MSQNARVRLLRVAVQWTAVYDDGDTLEELVCQPLTLTAADWPGVVARIDGDLARIAVQIEEAGGFAAFAQAMAAGGAPSTNGNKPSG